MDESKKNAIPTEKQFKLEKVKLAKDGGLEAQYEATEIVNDESYVNNYHVANGKAVHPDLKGLFEDLKPIVARVFNMTSFLTLLEAMELSESTLNKAREYADSVLKNIDVRGVSYSGEGDNVGVVVSAIYETKNGLKTAINTPRIKLATVTFGFEEELEVIVSRIEREVYAFLFEGKQAQLSLFGQE